MGAQSLLFVTVVIPHKGDDKVLFDCIRALRNQTYPGESRETIVVLNEEVQRALEFSLDTNESLVWEPRYFSYNARNAGIRVAKGAVIALTDSDTVPAPEWLERAVAAVNKGCDLVAGAIHMSFSQSPLSAAACYEKLYAFDQEKNVQWGRAATANLVGRTELFVKSPFNSARASGEDFAWTKKATHRGVTLTYEKSAIVQHPARETLGDLLAKAKRVSRGHESAEGGGPGMTSALKHYFSLYVAMPSRTKRQICTPREKVLAYGVAILVQVAKAFFTSGHKFRLRVIKTMIRPKNRALWALREILLIRCWHVVGGNRLYEPAP